MTYVKDYRWNMLWILWLQVNPEKNILNELLFETVVVLIISYFIFEYFSYNLLFNK